MANKQDRDSSRPRRKACAWCGYDHDDDFESELASRWHEAHDASTGKRFDLGTLKELW